MRRIFSTDDVNPRDRFEYWTDVACSRVVLHETFPADRDGFEAKLSEASCAEVGIFLVECSPMLAEHTLHHVGQEPDDYILLFHKLGGEFRLTQDGREARLATGEMGFLDPRRPCAAAYGAETQIVIVKLPREAVEMRVGDLKGLTARQIGTAGEAALSSAYLQAITEHVGTICDASAQAISTQFLDLLALGVTAQTAYQGTTFASATHVHAARIRSFIALNMCEPALDAACVARGVGLGLRHANRLLGETGTSLSTLILSMRLARCKAALQDPIQKHRSISEIAYGWGFADMSHFARRFRETYGMSPSAYRQQLQSTRAESDRLIRH